MNRRELISRVNELSGVEYETCVKVIDGLEEVISKELSESRRVRFFFDKIYTVMSYFNNKRNNN